LTQTLAAGTYGVAVSGAGNRYFYPFLAGSGYPGSTGAYTLSLQASAADDSPGGTPSGPTPGATQDTPGTALDLGNPGSLGGNRVQVSGFPGADPADPPGGEASEVDLYHFRITAPGTYALGAEVFAGRIGSPLDPALTLFRRDTDGTLALVASNGNTDNS